ncbi:MULTISPECIES: hypothetical protein [unclassified Kitasatospora]|uniref:hypothetical protein n=1 Tax=unclassified Kitasatospora TaxID=2633591 RepID=UPI000710FF64|nr:MULTISPECIES: hypothetical protein [unclassified Kitasatospora]KQV15448.1 hypothetical protein ASC99_07575 [Kitasatospora sp. Root107]KRB63964.1 hypothetical protein ASE03_05290 [Kitasatospora sp. Root187]
MSQKNSDTDGTGAPTERLLREALAARAGAIGVHDLAPVAPPRRRLGRLRPVRPAPVPPSAPGCSNA